MNLCFQLKKYGCIVVTLLGLQIFLHSSTICAQEKSDTKPSGGDAVAASEEAGDEESEPAKEEQDPFAVPADASVADLFKYIEKTKRVAPPKRDMKSITEFAKKLFPAIIAAADAILEQSDNVEEQEKAIEEKFMAYGLLSRFDPSASQKLKELSAEYENDERPGIAKIAVGYNLRNQATAARSTTEQGARELADAVAQYIARFGIDKTTLDTATLVARSLGSSPHSEIAAGLYEDLVPYLEASDDEKVRSQAEYMMGSARRLRLLGNTMTLQGLTAAGEEFDWSKYKGKVVLVDFWASWCGPCMSELPNMKKNLKLYGSKGFDIVGINMDSTRAAFEKCVKDREISWDNIVSEEAGKTGWSAPMAVHYGITGIPTAILVDQQGKVVSLTARGAKLDKALAELLGPPDKPELEEEEQSAEVGADDL